MTVRTTLVPGAPWPKVEDWPAPIKRTYAPRTKPNRPRATESMSESVVRGGVFQHPTQTRKPRRQKLTPAELDLRIDRFFELDRARQQLERPETRHSVRKTVHLNLKKEKK